LINFKFPDGRLDDCYCTWVDKRISRNGYGYPGIWFNRHVYCLADRLVRNSADLDTIYLQRYAVVPAWVVVDKNIPYQQNISNLPCIIIVLDVIRNTLANISPLLPNLLAAPDEAKENKVIVIPKPN
jgi:hypothetical protein